MMMLCARVACVVVLLLAGYCQGTNDFVAYTHGSTHFFGHMESYSLRAFVMEPLAADADEEPDRLVLSEYYDNSTFLPSRTWGGWETFTAPDAAVNESYIYFAEQYQVSTSFAGSSPEMGVKEFRGKCTLDRNYEYQWQWEWKDCECAPGYLDTPTLLDGLFDEHELTKCKLSDPCFVSTDADGTELDPCNGMSCTIVWEDLGAGIESPPYATALCDCGDGSDTWGTGPHCDQVPSCTEDDMAISDCEDNLANCAISMVDGTPYCDCSSDPLRNGPACTAVLGCNTLANPDTFCNGHGLCNSGANVCDCDLGFGGLDCSINYCDACTATQDCEPMSGLAVCVCKHGWEDQGNSECSQNVKCDGFSCPLDNTHCYAPDIDVDSLPACVCDEGWGGNTCTNDILDACLMQDDDACGVNGTCADGEGTGWSCTCPDDGNCYTSPGCTQVSCGDACATIKCEYDAPCVNGACNCTGTGRAGEFCGMLDLTDDCIDNDHCDHGTCRDTGLYSFVCDCDNGYTGTTCTNSVDECLLKGFLCNGGTCVDKPDKIFQCDCSGTGMQGEYCDIPLNCENNNCQDNADTANGCTECFSPDTRYNVSSCRSPDNSSKVCSVGDNLEGIDELLERYGASESEIKLVETVIVPAMLSCVVLTVAGIFYYRYRKKQRRLTKAYDAQMDNLDAEHIPSARDVASVAVDEVQNKVISLDGETNFGEDFESGGGWGDLNTPRTRAD
jgi:hypothetical protein